MLFKIVTRPGTGPPPQIQHCEDEYFYVLEEDYEFLLEGRTLRADAGCLLHVPKGILHAHKNVGNGVGRMLLTHTPGGLYERFFEEIGKAVDGGARPLSFEGQADAGRVAQIASGYGIEIPQHSTRQRAKIHHRNKAQAGRSTSLPERGGQDYANRHAD